MKGIAITLFLTDKGMKIMRSDKALYHVKDLVGEGNEKHYETVLEGDATFTYERDAKSYVARNKHKLSENVIIVKISDDFR